jgi:hypothetical protein
MILARRALPRGSHRQSARRIKVCRPREQAIIVELGAPILECGEDVHPSPPEASGDR